MRVKPDLRSGAALVLAAGCTIPFLYLLLLSVAGGGTFPEVIPAALRFDIWRELLAGTGDFLSSILSSLFISATVGLGATLGGFLAGKYVAYHRHRRSLLFLSYLPFVMSPVVLGACIHLLYIKLGLAGTVAGVISAQMISAYGFGVIFFSNFWNRERGQLEEVARSLGGSTAYIYRAVLLPAARDFLLICFLQTFLFSWFQYGVTLLIGAGKVRTLPMQVFIYIGEANVRYAAASSLVLILPPVLMLWANRRFMYRYM